MLSQTIQEYSPHLRQIGEMMKVSIVIPVYNSEKYLNTCIDTVISQTYKDIEVVIVENGSTDNSLEICNRFAKSDARIQVIHTGNIGTGAARNLGISKATGEYICFLDADDWFDMTLIEKYIESVQGRDFVICGYSAFRDDADVTDSHSFGSHIFSSKEEVRTYVATWFPDGRVGFTGNKFYKLSVIKDNNILFPAISRLEDGFFNLDFFSHVSSGVVIPDELYHYRLAPASVVIQKHNEEYADLVVALTDATLEKRKEWNLSTPTDEAYKFCLNELGTSIENVFVGNWGMDYLSRKNYLIQITLVDTYEDAQKHLELIGTYRRLLHILLGSNHLILLELLVRIKTFGKGKLSWLYYHLKK